jgi:hypothetical protein
MKSYIVKIFPKTKDFESELLDFLFEKSIDLKRDFSIDNILKTEDSPRKIDNLFENRNNIQVEEVYGSTFQSYWRTNKDIYSISHHIHEISKIGKSYYAKITASEYGEIIDFHKGILRPVYYRPEENKEVYKIATFDIDFNITKDKMS